MQYKASAWYFKLLAWILVVLCLAGGFFSAMVTGLNLGYGYYDPEHVFQTDWRCAEQVKLRSYDIITQFRSNPTWDAWERLLEDSDLRFIILEEESGEVLESYVKGMDLDVPDNLADNFYLHEYNYSMRLGEAGTFLENVYVIDYYFGETEDGTWWANEYSYSNHGTWQEPEEMGEPITDASRTYQVLLLLPQKLTKFDDRIGQSYELYREMVWLGERMPVVLGICAVGLLAAVIFLCIQSGRRPGLEQAKRTALEKIPLEIHLFAAFWAVVGIIGLIIVASDLWPYGYLSVWEWYLAMIVLSAGAAGCGVVVVELLLTFVLRIKLGTLWRSTLCYHIFRFIAKCFSALFGASIRGFCAIGMVPRAALTAVGVLFIELLLLIWLVNTWSPEFPIMALLIFNGALLGVLIWAAAQMRILQKSARALAEGDLEHQVDTAHMYWDFKNHGENLNAISIGMGRAVEKQMKSERLKTELITNVSHDIKTPLTSIVNYVDLLQKPHTEAEGIQYLEVLDRQSKRLKKLTENLVEASKASTGNMAVELKPTSVMELINQSVEEYRDRLEAGKLEIVVSQRGDLSILADGKLMWRIMDNLLNNVVKYALPGTRVYVTAQKFENRVVIAVKNISREPLNVDAEELMERFVRGDSSRHTEGTGLGLNIARSLTVLQNGQFSLTVDGDFFKAEIFMPVA